MIRFLAPALALVRPVVLLAPWARRRTPPDAAEPAGSGAGRARALGTANVPGRRARTPRAPRRLGGGAVAPGSLIPPIPPIPPFSPVATVVAAVGAVVVAATAVGIPGPVVLGVGIVLVLGRARLVSVRRHRRGREIERAGPDLVDLLTVAAAAGHPPHRCLHVVAERAPPAVQPSVRASCRRLERGVPLAVAVDELRRGLGALGDPVADALLDAFRTGAPLQPALARVGEVARDRRRREAEAEARRLPVLLLFPLVCCVLPAFGLLAVVPLIAASVRSLG